METNQTEKYSSSNFILALDLIGDMIGLYSHWIAKEKEKHTPDSIKLEELIKERINLQREQQNLNAKDKDQILSVIDRYVPILKKAYSSIEK